MLVLSPVLVAGAAQVAAGVAAAGIGQQAIAHAQGRMYHIGADEELNARLALARTSP